VLLELLVLVEWMMGPLWVLVLLEMLELLAQMVYWVEGRKVFLV
jgi:hypothetical protein